MRSPRDRRRSRTSTLSVRSAQDLGIGEQPLISTSPTVPARTTPPGSTRTAKTRTPAPRNQTPPRAPSTGPVRGPVPGTDEIIFLPLGGCNRIGMNMTLYGHAGKWLIVDAGVAFGGDDMPEVQSFMVDPAFIEERMEDVVGLVVTHAHEDHIGAIHHLWPRLECPIYATPFATHLIRERLKEAGVARAVQVNTFPIGGRFRIGPFDIEAIAVTHSVPEPVSLAIRTRAGNLLHTGDWKFDPEPLVGQTTDFQALKRLGDEGVLAMVCDSTNAQVEGTTGSEGQARAGLVEAFRGRRGAIAVTCFASNVARMKAIAEAAAANDRKVVLAGRSLLRMEKAARACGYLDGLAPFLSLSEASNVARRNLVLICTGSQGEERSALSKIARAEHRSLALQPGDTVIFSARTIPGNEDAIAAIYKLLTQMGVSIVTPSDAPVHVSGHPARADLTRMYELVRPRFAVPVHGEIQHLEAHARLARGCGVERALVPEDGDVIRLAEINTSVIGHIEPARLVNDGQFLLPWAGSVEETFGIRAEQRAERKSSNHTYAAA